MSEAIFGFSLIPKVLDRGAVMPHVKKQTSAPLFTLWFYRRTEKSVDTFFPSLQLDFRLLNSKPFSVYLQLQNHQTSG